MRSRFSEATLIKVASVTLWDLSAALMIFDTFIVHSNGAAVLSWALWIQMCAWGFTAWWIADKISTRNQLRVTQLAEIMARVAVEEQHPRHVKLRRVH